MQIVNEFVSFHTVYFLFVCVDVSFNAQNCERCSNNDIFFLLYILSRLFLSVRKSTILLSN